jgi:hypothetical protein
MADQTHEIDAVNGPVLSSGYSETNFRNTLKYLIPKIATDNRLIEIANGEGFEAVAATYDGDGVVTTATVKWPDGSAGVFTTTVKNTDFLVPDAFTITHVDSGKTVTQATVTRDADGNVTVKPAMTVT